MKKTVTIVFRPDENTTITYRMSGVDRDQDTDLCLAESLEHLESFRFAPHLLSKIVEEYTNWRV